VSDEKCTGTEEPSTQRPREQHWRWPREPASPPGQLDPPTYPRVGRLGLPIGVIDNDQLRREVIDAPDDDTPRRAYAAWMAAQGHHLAHLTGAFVGAQLDVAQAFRDDRRADVGRIRNWTGGAGDVSMTDFRAGDSLRPWYVDSVSALIARGLVGWPQVYRGFVERVGVRAHRLLQIGEELLRIAPIRYLVVIGVPAVVDELAAWPHLSRIRSLSLPRYTHEDELTDDTLRRLLASPHLGRLAHLRLVHQRRLTARSYEHVVTTPTLPQLSGLEVYAPLLSWQPDPPVYDPRLRGERMIAYDTAARSVRSKEWIAGLERRLGYVPCVHPEEHYGREPIDIEAIVERPIARDADVMARRGLRAADLASANGGPR
jgi:uncharacterized protein (TIGR02996 family)